MGFQVKVGNIVWNQVKPALSDNPNHIRLIYSSDIKDQQVILSNFSGNEKKHYVDSSKLKRTKHPYTIPMLLINRGYGKGSYQFKYTYIDGSYPYYVENHLLCVIPTNHDTDRTHLESQYNIIMRSFRNTKTT